MSLNVQGIINPRNFSIMKKQILNLGKSLKKSEQRLINGGTGCVIYTPVECSACGGFSLPNGCCLGSYETHACLGEDVPQ